MISFTMTKNYRLFGPMVAVFLMSSGSSASAQQIYGRGPTITPLVTPGIPESSFVFSPNSGVTCPTVTFSVGGFGVGGNDWASEYTDYNSASAGANNYGVSAGLKIPFGGELAKFCKQYAKAFAEQRLIEKEGALRNNQIKLLTQCEWLLENKINPDQAIFKKGGAFESLGVCIDYNPARLPGPIIVDKLPDQPPSRTSPQLPSPPLAPESVAPPVQLFQQIR